MADIRRFPFIRHLRGESSSHLLKYRRGKLVLDGRGLTFWFRPMTASIAEIPVDQREISFLFHGRSSDFQDISAQGVITYRIVDPVKPAFERKVLVQVDDGESYERCKHEMIDAEIGPLLSHPQGAHDPAGGLRPPAQRHHQ